MLPWGIWMTEEGSAMERPADSASSPDTVLDPVCGMSVQLPTARAAGLVFVHEGIEYGFCGRGCRLEFEEDPATYLAPGYVPSM
jgi:YHS domain-containing protein